MSISLWFLASEAEVKTHSNVLCVPCHLLSWFADGTLPAYEDNIKFCWSILWAGSVWCLYWKQKSKGPLWKVNVVSQHCLEEKKTLLFKHAKDFSLHSKKTSVTVNFSGNVALDFMWKILAYINDEHIRLLLLNNEGACTQSHLPERNQTLVRKGSFSMPEFPRSQNVGWGRVFKGLGKSSN